MHRALKIFFISIILTVTLGSCQKKFYPSQFYRNLEAKDFSPNSELLSNAPLTIKNGDQLKITVLSNNGEALITPSGLGEASGASSFINAIVDDSGSIFLPQVGQLTIAGNTLFQANFLIAQAYSRFINDPFVQVEWTGKNVFVFSGNDALARRVAIVGNRLELIDAIAQAGGISESNASKIDLVRRNGDKVNFYRIDLSDKNNVVFSYIPLKENDIIYAYPAKRPVKKIVDELLPYMTLVTTGLLIYNLFK